MGGQVGPPAFRHAGPARMMLLDTHVMLWMTEGDERLGLSARDEIEAAPILLFSAISAWEIAMLTAKSKGVSTLRPEALVRHVVETLRLREVAVGTEIAVDAGGMPRDIHGDPCDRIIMASARALDCPLVTADRKILAYAAAGHLKAIDARV